jgi:hypothetical protein
VGSIAPVSQKQKTLNNMLKDFATEKNMPFVDIRGIFDRDTGAIRNGMLNGIHYSDIAVKILAKAIKGSLYDRKLLRSYRESTSDQCTMSGMSGMSGFSKSSPIMVDDAPSQHREKAEQMVTALTGLLEIYGIGSGRQ